MRKIMDFFGNRPVMTFVVVAVFILFFLGGCAGVNPATYPEMFPKLNNDPEVGLIIMEGAPAANFCLRDQAGRCMEIWGYRGGNPALTFNGRERVSLKSYRLPQGCYKAEVRPFYYQRLRKEPVELRHQHHSFCVDDNPSDYYDDRYTGKHWGWILRINTGSIPKKAYWSPQVDISGRGGLPSHLINALFNGGCFFC